MTAPVLIACSHGTAEASARDAIHQLVASARDALDVDVLEAFVDVQEPRIATVVEGIARSAGVSAVVVPLLLSGGYHVYVDVARAVEARRDVVASRALGPDRRLLAILLDRLAEAGTRPDAAVVLAAAGSSDESSRRDTDAVVEMLAGARAAPVYLGFAAGIHPTVAEAVRDARDAGASAVAVASFLLAPGTFQARLATSGADVVTSALAPDLRLVEIVVERYREAADTRSD